MVILQQNGIDNIDDLLCTPDSWQETQAYTVSRVTTIDGTQDTEQLNVKNFEVNQIFMIKDYRGCHSDRAPTVPMNLLYCNSTIG